MRTVHAATTAAASSEEIRRAIGARARAGTPAWANVRLPDREYLGFDPGQVKITRHDDLVASLDGKPIATAPEGSAELGRALAGALSVPGEDLAVTMMIDRSGSLTFNPDAAPVRAQRHLAYAAAAMNRAGVLADVWGYSGLANLDAYELARSGEGSTGALAAFDHVGGGAGDDTAALAFGVVRLGAQPVDRRVLLIVTDDRPSTNAARQVAEAARDGVQAVYLIVSPDDVMSDAQLDSMSQGVPWLRATAEELAALPGRLARPLSR